MDTTTKVGAVISMGGGLVISIFHGSFISIAMSGEFDRIIEIILISFGGFPAWI